MFVIITFLVSLSQLHYVSFSAPDPYFGTCEPEICGDVNITYPFHVIDQQKPYCGYPGFEVTCQNGTLLPYLDISGGKYVIKSIWYKNQTLQVINSAFASSSDCSSSIGNLTLENDFFKLASKKNMEIVLLQRCPDSVLKTYAQDLVNCGALAMNETDPRLKVLSGQCKSEVVTVPCYDEKGNGSSESIKEVLSKGVLLNWTANNCSDCLHSGGQCGFNQTVSRFMCYCYDRPHSHLCPTPVAATTKHKKRWPLILGLSIAGGLTLLVLLAAIWCRNKLNFGSTKFVSRRIFLGHTSSDAEKGSIYFGVPLFSYRELDEATNSFHESRELGDGGFGTVYYGKLKDGREVAVKRLFEKNYKRVEQFMNEVQILTRLRHQNLVTLYGCTSSQSRELLLVYEYVPNGTVADHLYGDKSKPGSFQWPVRLRIAIETASALAYLHASDIIHRDIKTNNILLDSSFSVKVADFGLSRLFPTHVTHVSTAPQGTPGYLDPEYHQCYQLTDKSDVYSFGVVLIELISSLTAVDMERHRQEINLSNYAMNRIQRCAFDELVDPNIGYGSDFKVTRMTTSVAELAFQCLQHDKEFRPSMDEVLESLKRIEDADYEALKAEEEKRNHGKMSGNKPPPSPSENDDVKLLVHHRQTHPESPDSVMGKWGSRSTTPSTSKGNELTDC